MFLVNHRWKRPIYLYCLTSSGESHPKSVLIILAFRILNIYVNIYQNGLYTTMKQEKSPIWSIELYDERFNEA